MGTGYSYKASCARPPDRVKPSFVIFDIRALHYGSRSWASECPDVKNYKWRLLNTVWHRMLYS